MRIVHLLPAYLPILENFVMGAIPAQTLELGLKQEELGHEVFFISSKSSFHKKAKIFGTIKYEKGISSSSENILKHYDLAKNLISNLNPDIVHEHLSKLKSDLYFSSFKTNFSVLSTLRANLDSESQLNFLNSSILNNSNKNLFLSGLSNRQNSFTRNSLDYIVPHGIDEDLFTLGNGLGDYLLSIGRIKESKGIHLSIEAAKKLDEKLILIGDFNRSDSYFEKRIKPFIDGEQIVYLGPIPKFDLIPYIQNAKLFLNPVLEEEAFGLTIVENAICGTPVISFDRGIASDLISDNENGFLVSSNSLDELIEKVSLFPNFDRKKVRDTTISKGFNLDSSVKNYLNIYREILER